MISRKISDFELIYNKYKEMSKCKNRIGTVLVYQFEENIIQVDLYKKKKEEKDKKWILKTIIPEKKINHTQQFTNFEELYDKLQKEIFKWRLRVLLS